MAKIKLEKDLYERAVACADEMGYSSVDELVVHLLERALKEREKPSGDQGAVEERLRGLGYLE